MAIVTAKKIRGRDEQEGADHLQRRRKGRGLADAIRAEGVRGRRRHAEGGRHADAGQDRRQPPHGNRARKAASSMRITP